MRKYFVLSFCLCLMLSCVSGENGFREAFQQEESIYMNCAGQTLFYYDENNCQYSFHAGKSLFRVFSDNQANWLSLDCKGASLEEGERVTADLEWTTTSNVERMNKLNLELVKISNGVYYFWSSQYNIALRLRAE